MSRIDSDKDDIAIWKRQRVQNRRLQVLVLMHSMSVCHALRLTVHWLPDMCSQEETGLA